MVKTGKVVANENGYVKVCFERPEACARCGQCGDFRETLVRLEGNASPGDTVEVYFPEGQLLKYTAVAYLIPLAGILAGLLIGSLVFGSEAGEIVLALALGGAAACLVALYDRRVRKKGGGTPRIVKTVSSERNGAEA